jgi:Domain of unknown function (DUF5753)
VSGCLVAVLSLAGSLLAAAIGDAVSEEIRDRLDHLPHAILRLAAARLSAADRAARYDGEWLPELTYILKGNEARPVTRLYHGTRFALGILMAARRITRTLRRAEAAWPRRYPGMLLPWTSTYLGLEARAAVIREFQFMFIPMCLQVDDYTRALIRKEDELPVLTTRLAQAREAHQAAPRPRRKGRQKLQVVIHEAALRSMADDLVVMRAQLAHLIEMCDHPALTLQVLPFSAGSYRAMEHSFAIIQYARRSPRCVIITREFTGPALSARPDETEICIQLFEDASAKAEPAGSTRSILERILADLGPG